MIITGSGVYQTEPVVVLKGKVTDCQFINQHLVLGDIRFIRNCSFDQCRIDFEDLKVVAELLHPSNRIGELSGTLEM